MDLGELNLDDMTRPMTMAADTGGNVLAGRPASFSWRTLAGGPAEPTDLRRFIEVEPVLDFMVLHLAAATDAIAQTASGSQTRRRLSGAGASNRRIRPTTTSSGPSRRTRPQCRRIAACGSDHPMARTALGADYLRGGRQSPGRAGNCRLVLFLVGALNLISIAFFVLFIGLGVDFGIQFNVRYRAERHDYPELRIRRHSTAVKVGGPLALAALATAVGFSSFLPIRAALPCSPSSERLQARG